MTKFVRFVFAIAIAGTLHFSSNAQSVSINTTGAVAAPSAMLDVTSTAKGVLVPRMDKTAKNAIASPANGLLVYQTGPDSIGFHYYDLTNTRWVFINASGFATDTTAWKLTGNSNVTSASFLGTLNDSAVRFKVRNYPSGIIDSISGNTALGYRGGFENNTTGKFNVAMGFNALRSNTTGSNNVGIGVQAGFVNDTASRNTSVGRDALYFSKHNDNTGLGYGAGTYVDYDPVNFPTKEKTYIGGEAGNGDWAGSKSVGVGFRALYNVEGNTIWGSSVGRNVAIGDSAMGLTYSSRNVAIGTEALSRARSSSQNVAIGDSAMGGALTTAGNVAVGYKTLSKQYNTNGLGFNTAVGYFSQRDSSVNTYYNTSIGAYSMEFNRTGIYNTGLGLSAMRNADSTSYNTAIGADAMYNHKKNGSNLAAGAFALRGDSAGYWNTAVGSEAMDRNGLDGTARGTGFSNVAVGFRALRGARQAFENTAVGVGALESDSSGNYNSAVGRYSSFLNKSGDFNVSMGYRAAQEADTATAAVAIGSYALSYNQQDNNVAMGYAAGYTAGSQAGFDPKEITFIGYEAGRGSWASNKNTSLGFRALSNTDAGFGFYDYTTGRNTVIGDSAMAFSIGGSNTVMGAVALSNAGVAGTWNNVAIGDSAMGAALSNGGALFDNVAVGYRSMPRVKNQGNIAIGAYAGNELGNTIWNTAIGYHALETDTTGNENTVVGTSAFRNNADGIRNVSLGINTGYWATGSNNTYLGSYAGQGVSGRTTGSSNVAVGDYAMTNARSAAQNVAVGESALGSDSTGNLNVAIGAGAMDQHLRGNENVGVGFWAGRLDTASVNAVYVGSQAGYNNNRNSIVAVGYKALYSNSSTATLAQALDNVAVGSLSLANSTTGSNNTAVGNSSLQSNITGDKNTSIGYSSNVSATNLVNATAIGANALVAQSNTMVLGSINGINSATSDTKVGIRTTTPDSTFSVADNFLVGSSGTVQYDNSVPVMNYMFKTGIANADRMVIAHSPANASWGLQYQDASDQFNFLAGGINRVAIELASGQVGLGIAAPSKHLHVYDGASGAVFNGSSQILMEDNANSYFEMSTPDANENGILSSNTAGIRSAVIFNAANGINFRAGGNTNRMTINNAGQVGIGLAPTTQLELSLNSAQKPTSSTWFITSDANMKTIDGQYSRGLQEVLKLNTIIYHYKPGNLRNLPTDETGYGFTAQEVQKIFPEAVHTGKDGFLSLDMHPILVSYVNAFKEQQQIIDKQQKTIDDIKKKNEQLEKDMQVIKAKLGINN